MAISGIGLGEGDISQRIAEIILRQRAQQAADAAYGYNTGYHGSGAGPSRYRGQESEFARGAELNRRAMRSGGTLGSYSEDGFRVPMEGAGFLDGTAFMDQRDLQSAINRLVNPLRYKQQDAQDARAFQAEQAELARKFEREMDEARGKREDARLDRELSSREKAAAAKMDREKRLDKLNEEIQRARVNIELNESESAAQKAWREVDEVIRQRETERDRLQLERDKLAATINESRENRASEKDRLQAQDRDREAEQARQSERERNATLLQLASSLSPDDPSRAAIINSFIARLAGTGGLPPQATLTATENAISQRALEKDRLKSLRPEAERVAEEIILDSAGRKNSTYPGWIWNAMGKAAELGHELKTGGGLLDDTPEDKLTDLVLRAMQNAATQEQADAVLRGDMNVIQRLGQ